MPPYPLSALLALLCLSAPVAATEPVRLVVAGLTHTHVHWIFERAKRRDAVGSISGRSDP